MPQSQIPHTDISQGAESFQRTDRVRRRRHYLSIQKRGKRVHTANFVFVLHPNEEGRRLGITVTRRVKRAVDRNRIKRLLREVFRRNRGLFPSRSDVVAIARPGAEQLDYRRLREEVRAVDAVMARAVRKVRSRGEQAPRGGKARRP